jgi:hypothetical protein
MRKPASLMIELNSEELKLAAAQQGSRLPVKIAQKVMGTSFELSHKLDSCRSNLSCIQI